MKVNSKIAREWLQATGWEIRGKRAFKKDRANIPAPDGELYELHDVAWEEGVGASKILEDIKVWAAKK